MRSERQGERAGRAEAGGAQGVSAQHGNIAGWGRGAGHRTGERAPDAPLSRDKRQGPYPEGTPPPSVWGPPHPLADAEGERHSASESRVAPRRHTPAPSAPRRGSRHAGPPASGPHRPEKGGNTLREANRLARATRPASGLLKPRSPHLRAAGERERQAARTSPPGKGAQQGPLGAPLTLLCGVSSTPNGPPEPGPLHPPSEGQLSAWQGAAAIAGGWADRGMLRSHQQLTPDGEEDRCHPPPPQPRGSVQPHLPQSPFLLASHPPPLPRPDPEGRKEGKTQRGPGLSPELPWGETRGVSDSRACSKAKLKPHKPHVQDSRIPGFGVSRVPEVMPLAQEVGKKREVWVPKCPPGKEVERLRLAWEAGWGVEGCTVGPGGAHLSSGAGRRPGSL